ncbi:MAG: GbsR/MarR family transcriptional regulator [Kiritimatiellia bacterium]
MHAVVKACVEDAGNLAQALGVGRVVGQIYAYLYFSEEPKGLADLQTDLKISKGSASMCVRQLEQWDAVRKVHVAGDRKDYYTANAWFGRVLKNVLTDQVNKRFVDRAAFYAQLDGMLDADVQAGQDCAFLRERVTHIQTFEEKARKMWSNPLVQHFFK